MLKKTILSTSMVAFGVGLAVFSVAANESRNFTHFEDALTPSKFEITLEQLKSQAMTYQTRAKLPTGTANKEAAAIVDLFVWFQPAYLTKIGVQSAHSRFSEMVDEVNQAFLDSEIDVSIRLVNAEPLRNVSDELPLQSTIDSDGNVTQGALDRFNSVVLDVNARSEGPYYEYKKYAAYGADLVMYARDFREAEQTNLSLGVGANGGQISAIFDRYNGLSDEFMFESYSIFKHVIGHNFGGDHEVGKISTLTSESDARATTCDGGKNTIMWSGYDKNNAVSVYSNPNIQLGGEFCGELGKTDNTRVINSNAVITSNRWDAPDSLGIISFSQTGYTANETDGTVTITLTREGSLSGESEVELAILDDSATVGNDIAITSGVKRVFFSSGEASVTVVLNLIVDEVAETQESVNLILRYPLAATVTATQAKLTIEESGQVNPGEVDVSVSEAKVEGQDVVVTLNRSNGSDGEISFEVATGIMTATADLDAATADDFTALNTAVTFADGETQKTLNISTLDDDLVESTEGFSVMVTAKQNSIINNSQNVAQILDNDEVNAGSFTLSAADSQVNEDVGTLELTIDRTGGSDGAVEIGIAVEGGGEDFAQLDTTSVVFADGEVQKAVVVRVLNNNSTAQTTQNFSVVMTTPETVTASVARVTVTVLNDDEATQTSTADSGGGAFGWLSLLLAGLVFRKRQ